MKQTLNPMLVIDLLPETSPQQIAACAAANAHRYRVRQVTLGWTASQQYDYATLDARLDALFAADPQAHFWLEIDVNAPAWWRQAHLTECAAYCHSVENPPLPPASWASKRWRTEAGQALQNLLRHVQSGGRGRQLLGAQIAAGEDGTWRQEQAERLPDIGPRMTDQFRNFALDKYRRNEGLLRKGWFDARADFTGITCPSARDRTRADMGIFRNPARSRRLLDYYEAYYQAQNNAALHFCETAKRALGDGAMVGLTYATLFGNEDRAEAGHAYPEAVFDAECVDFFVSPAFSSPERENISPKQREGEGALLRVPTGSLALREKALFCAPAPDIAPLLAAAVALTHNAGLFLPATTAAEDLQTVLRLTETAARAQPATRKRVSQVAILIDPTASLYVHSGAGWLNQALLSEQCREMIALGAPVDIYLFSDIFHPKLPDYKVWLLTNSFYLSEAERRRVDARLKRSEHTAIFAVGVGTVNEERVAAENGQQVVGQKMRMEPKSTNLRVRIAETDDPLTWGQKMNATFGTERAIAPTVTITDRAITRLGANTDNKTNFSALRNPTWTSVFCGGVPLPLPLLQNVLRAAGCHLYAESQRVCADARSVAVLAVSPQPIKISLPGLHDVRDALTQEPIASHVTEFSVTLKPGAVGYYELRAYPAKKVPRPEPPEAKPPSKKRRH